MTNRKLYIYVFLRKYMKEQSLGVKNWAVLVLSIVLIVEVMALVFVAGFISEGQDGRSDRSIAGAIVQSELENVELEIVEGELRWSEMPIQYLIKDEDICGWYESNQIKQAFEKIESATDGVVSFERVNELENGRGIVLVCGFVKGAYEKRREGGVVYENIGSYERGLARITETSGSEIVKAEIELFGLEGFQETEGGRNLPSGFAVGRCGDYRTEIHEILHVFGFEHDEDENSIMYPTAKTFSYSIYQRGRCLNVNSEIDDWIVQDLKEVYG